MANEKEFASYVDERWAALVRSALFLGCSREDAEDLVQTTLVQCFRHWDRLQRADRIDAYVHRMLVNAFRRSNKRKWHLELTSDHVPSNRVEDPSPESDARTDLHRMLNKLPPDQRTVLVLRYITDLTERQVAEVLGIPVGTVKSRAARALAAIDKTALREGMG